MQTQTNQPTPNGYYSDKSPVRLGKLTPVIVNDAAEASKGWDNDSAFMAGNNLLITGSIGLYHWRTKFYMQVITAHNENNYIVEIPAKLAVNIAESEGLEITNATSEEQVRY